jgi:ABC-2 type transport system permease protein
MMTTRTSLAGVTLNEFRMQWRRKAMWFAMGAAGLFFLLINRLNFDQRIAHASARQSVAIWASLLNIFLPIAYGIVLADRLDRDRRLQVDELLNSYPAGLAGRVWGKALGASIATMVPFFLLASVGFIYVAIHLHSAAALPFGLAAFLSINLPALVFVGALCTILPALVWMPAVRVLLVAFWLWVQVPADQIPSLSNTILAPVGGYAAHGLFQPPFLPFLPDAPGILYLGPLTPDISAVTGLLSAGLILAIAVTILGVGPFLVGRGQDA